MEDFLLPMDAFEEMSVETDETDVNEGTPYEEDNIPGFDEPENNDAVEDEDPENVDGEDVNEDGDDPDNNGDSSSNLYSSLANVIHEQGLLPSIDITKEEIKSIDDFTKILQIEQEAQAKKRFDEYVSNLDVEKVAKPIQEIRNLENIDADYLTTNIEIAKDLIKRDYTEQGLSEDKVSRIINRLVDLGDEDLVDEAMKAKANIVENNNITIEKEKQRYALEKADNERRNAKIQEDIKKAVFEADLIPGFKANPAFRDKVYKNITTVVGEGPNGELENAFMKARREDMIGFETRMYAFYELTNGFTDFGKLALPAKSKAVEELEKAARGYKFKDNGTPAYVQEDDSYFGGSNFKLNI